MLFVWLLLYGGIYIAAESLSQKTGIAHSVTAPAMLLYVALLLFWLYRTDRMQAIGLGPIRWAEWKDYLFFLPFGVLPLYNFVTKSNWEISLAAAVLALCISVTEELFFRGFLLHCLRKWDKSGGIFLSSAVFALAHIANLNQVSDWAYVLMQILCAFAVGISFSTVTIRSGSLLPCIAAHCFINISAGSQPMEPVVFGFGLWACIAVYIGYGIWVLKKI